MTVKFDDNMRQGTMSLPHGYGIQHPNEQGEFQAYGVAVNELTDSLHCDKIAKTPFHKTVPARLVKMG